MYAFELTKEDLTIAIENLTWSQQPPAFSEDLVFLKLSINDDKPGCVRQSIDFVAR